MTLFAKKKLSLILALCLILVGFLFWKPILSTGIFLLVPSPDTCSLCDQEPREVPCLLNRNTGDVGPLAGTTVPGKFQFVGCFGAMGGWDSDSQTAHVTVPNAQDGLALSRFCRSCRFHIADGTGTTFVLLDLSAPETPVIYPVEEGAEHIIQDWSVSIQASQVENSFDLVVTPARRP